jgi:tetratricopeptide (TPR) repeat protein
VVDYSVRIFFYKSHGIASQLVVPNLNQTSKSSRLLADYDRTIQLSPDHVLAFNGRGLTKSALGDFDGALADYDKAIDLKPKPSDLAALLKNRENALRRKNNSASKSRKAELNEAIRYVINEAKRVGDPLKLPESVRMVFLVQGAQGIIDNGGLQYFFAWDWEGQPPYSIFIDAYRAIGAEAEADALAAAVASFPFADPHRHQEERRKFMEQFIREKGGTEHRADSPFERYDICGNQAVYRLLLDYISLHAAAFPD